MLSKKTITEFSAICNLQSAIGNQQLLLLALLLASFALRLHALLQLPGFVDEGNHLIWAVEVWQGRVVFPFSTAKPLEVFYLAALFPFRASLWVGRFGSVLISVVTLSALYALARSWGNGRAGLIAAAVYAMMPWTFFHERTAVADPLAAACAVLLAWVATRWVDRPPRWRTAMLIVCLFALPLAKYSALPMLMIPIAVVLLKQQTHWISFARRLLLPYGIAGAGLGVIIGLAALRYDVASEFTARAGSGPQNPFVQILGNVRDVMAWAIPYLGIIGVLVVAGVIAAALRRTKLSLLSLAGLMLTGGVLLAAPAGSFPRYYLPALAFASLLVAEFAAYLDQRLQSSRFRWAIHVVLIAVVAVPFAGFAAQAYTDPAQLNLAELDRKQHVTDWSSGYGIRDAVGFVADVARHESQPAIVYAGDLSTTVIAKLYWPADANGSVYEIWDAAAPDVIAAVPVGTPVYLIADAGLEPITFVGLNINPRELVRFARPVGGADVIVYKLVAEPYASP